MNIFFKKYDKSKLIIWDNFVLERSLNGTIYHTMNFLSYHKDRFNDCSILIYDKNITNLIAVFPCCEVDGNYYSHKGSTCGGIVILEKYYELNKLTEIMNAVYNYYQGKLFIKLSESAYFRNNIKNDLLNFILSQKCESYQDISLIFDLNKNDKIMDTFPKSRNKSLIKKYIENPDNNIRFLVSDDIMDYKKYYEILNKNSYVKNNAKIIHTLDEFIFLKNKLGDKQFLFISKNNNNEILSGGWILKINDQVCFAPYLATNYGKEKCELFYLLFYLFIYCKENNFTYVNLGACSTNGDEILYSLYKFKHSCGCEPFLKYSFTKNI